jgi:hypothetical protein
MYTCKTRGRPVVLSRSSSFVDVRLRQVAAVHAPDVLDASYVYTVMSVKAAPFASPRQGPTASLHQPQTADTAEHVRLV